MGPLISNIIIIMILLAAVFGACYYIYREKKKGRQCIGCPSSGSCPRSNNGKSVCSCNK